MRKVGVNSEHYWTLRTVDSAAQESRVGISALPFPRPKPEATHFIFSHKAAVKIKQNEVYRAK